MSDAVETISFDIVTYKNKNGLWCGVVVDVDNEPIVWGIACDDEQRAIRHAKSAFRSALSCSHTMVWSDYQMIGQDRAGNDLYGRDGSCSKCGYHVTFECEPDELGT